eukprot:CAMPEP_0178900894 /NCGR_PEP_ID=MMETSP0786-20121207/3718_1 /TAXON_ID=186022 /ORGANISM="Thalassionema frauenfeldii, Strain CCMP 1798" /LENGTH=595 /DNA_ID=CAMNT_0020571931 /DNA_START=98 /DNA_END=1884 /DNA_ORIENTATION=+
MPNDSHHNNIDDDVMTIATTSDCSEDRGPHAQSERQRSRRNMKKSPDVNMNYGDSMVKERLRDVQEYIELQGLSPSMEVWNARSYQHSAAKFMTTVSLPTTPTQVQKYRERYALACLYFATGGTFSQRTTTWKHSFLNYRSSVCQWQADYRLVSSPNQLLFTMGVFCNEDESVVELQFLKNGLTGKLPTFELKWLTNLQILHLDYNAKLKEDNKTSFSLVELSLDGCQLEGPLPSLPPLFQFLSVESNLLTGSIPITGQEMKTLRITDNMLTGDISSALQQSTKLQYLYLENNMLNETLDESFLSKHLDLEQMDISGNVNIRGVVPLHLPNLKVLDGHNTSLESFPVSVHNSSVLEFLSLHDNLELRGTIPSSLLPETLGHLDLSSTGVSGDMPSFDNLVNLNYLFLAHTNFNPGTIPLDYAALEQLVDLSLKNSNRIGTIPASFNSSNLVLLDLDDNDLTGTIPSGLFTENIQMMLLNNNRLNGTIPSSVGEATNLWLLLLNDNLLSGNIPEELLNLNQLKYFFVQNNPSLSGELTTDSSQQFEFCQTKVWKADCDVLECKCCICCDDVAEQEPVDDIQSCNTTNDFLLQYLNP